MSNLRPTSATAISIIWIVLGATWAMNGFSGAADSYQMAGMFGSSEDAQTMLGLFGAGSVLFGLLGVAGAACGVGLIKLREWARKWLRVINWIVVGGLGLFLLTWCGMLASAPSPMAMPMIVVGLFVCAIVGAPFVVMAKLLNGRTIREAIYRAEMQARNGEADDQAVAF